MSKLPNNQIVESYPNNPALPMEGDELIELPKPVLEPQGTDGNDFTLNANRCWISLDNGKCLYIHKAGDAWYVEAFETGKEMETPLQCFRI